MRLLKIIGFGLLFCVAGMAAYIFWLQKLCWSPAFYCGIYNWFAAGITIYSNFMMRFISPACVGGGPDSCIGPGLGLMLVTLLVIGCLIGWLISLAWKSK